MMNKIKSAAISPLPKKFTDDMPRVTVEYEDGTTEELFQYYPDEISFTPTEFIGLTRNEALLLKTKKDIAYLRS